MIPRGGQDPKASSFGDSDFVVVANRLPVDLERLPDGTTSFKRSPGGLVTALEPLLRRRRGAWVGWPGVVDDDVDVDDEPIVQEDLRLIPVRLTADDVAEYYEGFSNATLWPLYHDVIVKPIYHRDWWERYVEVNRRFAEATSRAAARGGTVWVQDYQLQLVPKMLRTLRPDVTIGFFLHIPFPPVELFMQIPWRTEIIEGLLGADLVGFHLAGGAQNFLILSRRLTRRQHLAGIGRRSLAVRSRRARGTQRSGGRLSHLHRLRGTRPNGPRPQHQAPRPGDPGRAGRPPQGPARRRPAGLHQGHRCAA